VPARGRSLVDYDGYPPDATPAADLFGRHVGRLLKFVESVQRRAPRAVEDVRHLARCQRFSVVLAVFEHRDDVRFGVLRLAPGFDHIPASGPSYLSFSPFGEEQRVCNLLDDPVTYGTTEVERALEFGAVETALVSASLDGERRDELEAAVFDQGGETVVVSDETGDGARFDAASGGVAALLRFPVN